MPNLKVLIIESSYPNDFYAEQLDGPLTHHLIKLLGIKSKLIYAVDGEHFKKAITFGSSNDYGIVHVSCHGGAKGLAMTDNSKISWSRFASHFAECRYSPNALVMSACCGGSNRVAEAFEAKTSRPDIIFGSTDARLYNEYAVAWAILYNAFLDEADSRFAAKRALQAINAVVHKNFRYRRWESKVQKYLVFPSAGRRYEVVEEDD